MKKGFTLIEILIVMAIISLLAAVMMPNIFKVQNKAKEAAVKAIMYSLQTELETFQLDNFNYPPGNDLCLAALAPILSIDLPKNPFTGAPYGYDDQAGRILYTYDQETGLYQIKAFKRDGKSVLDILTNN